ncbi:hypothetical protein [Stappia sp.]|uniref:hypothetical protein n=1 Tax=Stappia sp. TaxID=1870903 RepID=UPI0032D8FD8F
MPDFDEGQKAIIRDCAREVAREVLNSVDAEKSMSERAAAVTTEALGADDQKGTPLARLADLERPFWRQKSFWGGGSAVAVALFVLGLFEYGLTDRVISTLAHDFFRTEQHVTDRLATVETSAIRSAVDARIDSWITAAAAKPSSSLATSIRDGAETVLKDGIGGKMRDADLPRFVDTLVRKRPTLAFHGHATFGLERKIQVFDPRCRDAFLQSILAASSTPDPVDLPDEGNCLLEGALPGDDQLIIPFYGYRLPERRQGPGGSSPEEAPDRVEGARKQHDVHLVLEVRRVSIQAAGGEEVELASSIDDLQVFLNRPVADGRPVRLQEPWPGTYYAELTHLISEDAIDIPAMNHVRFLHFLTIEADDEKLIEKRQVATVSALILVNREPREP